MNFWLCTTYLIFLIYVVYNIVMILISETIEKEKKRITYMLNEYNKRLSLLPKGTLSIKQKGNKNYYYLKHREGNRVISKYISNVEIENIKNKIEERKHIEVMIKSLNKELKIANKALGVKQWFYIMEAML